ncbi:MAG TPA: transposase [Cyclobacteriaceae bacterium]|nr:transposase [Cyclobacteriaceae bacterium]
MGRKYLIRDQDAIYFLTFTVVHWIDIFTRNVYKEIFIESVKHCQQKKGLDVYAWCIMTNHIHAILGSSGVMKLEDIIRDFKSFTSRHIRKELEQNLSESRSKWILNLLYTTGLTNKRNNDFQLWQQHNHPIELSTNEMMDQRLDYTHYNPVKAGFVEKPEDWLWSSAMDYYGTGKGKLELKFIE